MSSHKAKAGHQFRKKNSGNAQYTSRAKVL